MKLNLIGFERLKQKPALAKLAGKICEKVPQLRRRGEINFVLVPDKKLRYLHKKFLDDPGSTDVITFQYLETQSLKKIGDDAPFGDVYISLETARAQAKAAGHEFHREVAFLMAHGLLHLAGYDDRAPHQRRKMLAFQTKIIRAVSPGLAPADGD